MNNPYHQTYSFNALPIRTEILTAQEFLQLKATQPNDIESCRPAPARLGGATFGGIEVTYTTPKYRVGL